MEHLDEALPSRLLISPGDRNRLQWQDAVRRDPQDPNGPFFALQCRPGGGGGQGNPEKRYPFSSSYELAPAFYSPDAVNTVSQASHHAAYTVPAGVPLGQRRLSEVRFPSQKAMLYEGNQRFFGARQLFFMYDEARLPVLLADGSAAVRSTSRCNPGFQPPSPSSPSPTLVNYQPDPNWETPTTTGLAMESVRAHMRFTRSGLRGRDFGGPEVPWVP